MPRRVPSGRVRQGAPLGAAQHALARVAAAFTAASIHCRVRSCAIASACERQQRIRGVARSTEVARSVGLLARAMRGAGVEELPAFQVHAPPMGISPRLVSWPAMVAKLHRLGVGASAHVGAYHGRRAVLASAAPRRKIGDESCERSVGV